MILQANFVLNNPALLLKYYDFNPAILHSLYLARNKLPTKSYDQSRFKEGVI